MYLLDSDHISIIQRRSMPDFACIEARMQQHASLVSVPIISFHEQVLGWNAYIRRARSPDRVVLAYEMFERILADFAAMEVMPFDKAASDCFEDLRRQKIRIGTMDLRIASIATSRNLVLVTRNAVDFSKVPGLQFEDWAIP